MSGSPLKRFAIWSSVEISEATEATELDGQNVASGTTSSTTTDREKLPYHYLSQQSRQMWTKWHNLEKETIVRESVMNRNVMLGQAFFMKALGYTQPKCSMYFDDVISKWVYDQLKVGDIDLAEDILTKAGHNPTEKMKEMCLNSYDAIVRDYLLEHLSKKNLIEEEEMDAWKFLRLFESALDSINNSKLNQSTSEVLDSDSPCQDPLRFTLPISLVISCGQSWQNIVWADILLNCSLKNYEAFMQTDVAWKLLISRNDILTISKWVSNACGRSKTLKQEKRDSSIDSNSESYDTAPLAEPLFSNNAISECIIAHGITQDMVDLVLAEDAIPEIKERIMDCLCRNGFHSTLETGWKMFRRFSRGGLIPLVADSWMHDNPYELDPDPVQQFVSICVDNALPEVLSICLPHHGRSIKDVFDYFKGPPLSKSGNERSIWGVPIPLDSSDVDEKTVRYPPLSSPSICSPRKLECQVHVRDLLRGRPPDSHGLLGGRRLAGVESNMEELRHFSQEQSSSSCNLDAQADFLYYLRQARPTYAATVFLVEQIASHGNIHNDSLSRACHLAQGLAMSTTPLSMVGTACAAFVAMVGGASDMVRLYLTAARICSPGLGVGKGFLDSSSLSQSPDACYEQLLKYLEVQCPMVPVQDEYIGLMFTYALNISLSKLCGKELPEALPKFFAENDLWLPFVLCLQIYRYPPEQVVHLVRSFKSPHLRGHLWHALQMVEPVACYRKAVYYSRIGIKRQQTTEQISQSSTSLPSDTAKPLPPSAQTASNEMWDAKTSLYTLLLRHHSRIDTIQPLPVVADNPPNPTLSVMETCLEGNSNVESLCKWLIATCWNFGLHESWAARKEIKENETASVTDGQTGGNNGDEELNRNAVETKWTHFDTIILLEEVVQRGYLTLLAKGFFIFLPDNPLHFFTKFLAAAVEEMEYHKALESLLFFKRQIFELHRNETKGCSKLVKTSKDAIWDTKTVLNMAYTMVFNSLATRVTAPQQRLNLIGIFRQAELFQIFSEEIPDMDILYGLQECLCKVGPEDLGVELDYSSLPPLVPGHPSIKWQDSVKNCLHQLIEREHYDIGLQFAEISNLPKDPVLVAQWKKNLEKYSADSSEYHNQLHLGLNVTLGPSPVEACSTAFVTQGISPDTAARFFNDMAKKMSSVGERYKMLKMALHWLGKANKINTSFAAGDRSETIDLEMDEVELSMWKCRLELEMNEGPSVEASEGPSLMPLRISAEKIRRRTMMREQYLNVSETPTALGSLIGLHLDAGDLVTAIRLESLFSHADRDVSLLLTCMALAEGDMYPEDAEPIVIASEEGATTIMPFQPSRLCRPGSLQSLSPVSLKSHLIKMTTLPGDFPAMNKEQTEACCKVLAMLERIVNQLQRGRSLGIRIVTCFRLAFYLNIPYLDILNLANPIEALRHHLWDVEDGDWVKYTLEKSSSQKDEEAQRKLSLASDILLAARLDRIGKAEFLRHEVVAAIQEFEEPGNRGAGSSSGKVLMWGLSLDDYFPAILDLCEDDMTCSLLGDSLLMVANDLVSAEQPHHRKVVELLVRAHDCHTRACNMEGISRILRHARILTSSFLAGEEWSLMVRLLTGIRRYTEMNYILLILREHEQFEYVLGKGMDKVPGLKVALLDFLRRHCPGDKELLRLVVLHFRLHSEAAELWLSEAKAIIAGLPHYTPSADNPLKKNLIAERCSEAKLPLFQCSDKLKSDLRLAIQIYSHAAEYYLQANQPNAASKCAHQAELAALQISMVDVQGTEIAPCLLRLEPLQIALIVKTILSFPQAWILVRAYEVSGNWAAAIYMRYVQGGDDSYLTDFMRCKSLTPTLMEDIARRYLLEGGPPNQQMSQRMANLLSAVPNIEVCYRLSSRLGLWGLTGSLLTSPHLPYLRDVVWVGGTTHNTK